ncbi:hypothetical protein DFH06DRAFT_59709 [Mycena polygramma]|nr:hypothetical protein DFH06DRAFT_59709 [Mycena polygramma]
MLDLYSIAAYHTDKRRSLKRCLCHAARLHFSGHHARTMGIRRGTSATASPPRHRPWTMGYRACIRPGPSAACARTRGWVVSLSPERRDEPRRFRIRLTAAQHDYFDAPTMIYPALSRRGMRSALARCLTFCVHVDVDFPDARSSSRARASRSPSFRALQNDGEMERADGGLRMAGWRTFALPQARLRRGDIGRASLLVPALDVPHIYLALSSRRRLSKKNRSRYVTKPHTGTILPRAHSTPVQPASFYSFTSSTAEPRVRTMGRCMRIRLESSATQYCGRCARLSVYLYDDIRGAYTLSQ